MSVKVMTRVWDTSEQAGSDLLLLLALADRADDDGICWPGIANLAQKTRSSERQTKRNISKLEDRGELYISYQSGKAGGRGVTNRYFVASGLDRQQIITVLQTRFDMDKETASKWASTMHQKLSEYKSEKGVTSDTPNKGDVGDTLNEKGDIQGQKRVTSRVKKGDIAMSPDSSYIHHSYPSIEERESIEQGSNPGNNSSYSNNSTPENRLRFQPLPSSLAEICKLNLVTLTRKQATSLKESTETLLKVGATPERIKLFEVYWYKHDWRGKKGEPPTPAQVCEEWGKFEAYLPQPNGVNGNGNTKKTTLTEEQRKRYEAMRAEEAT